MKDLFLDMAVELKWILKRQVGNLWIGHIWLSTETSVEHLWKDNKISARNLSTTCEIPGFSSRALFHWFNPAIIFHEHFPPFIIFKALLFWEFRLRLCKGGTWLPVLGIFILSSFQREAHVGVQVPDSTVQYPRRSHCYSPRLAWKCRITICTVIETKRKNRK